MTEDDTFNILSGLVISSAVGGFYCFVPDYRAKSATHPHIVWGKIHTYGNISHIIKDKILNEQFITEWLGGWKAQHDVRLYVQMCDGYARHLLLKETHD